MTRLASIFLVALGLAFVAAGCREEPTIVIKFEPNDLAGAKKPADMSTAPKPPVADLAVVTEAPAKKKGKAECKVAADCVVEPADCCDCANGGKQHAIPKKAAAASKAARAERCKTKMCTMMLSTDPTCGQRPDCVDGQCVMVPAKTKK